uniref:Glycerophosphocholine phosphodiesterase 1 n=1 Tax=Haplochromis burtoni TaxID=8153 RepID=A0A3Q2X7G5_HAPBU
LLLGPTAVSGIGEVCFPRALLTRGCQEPIQSYQDLEGEVFAVVGSCEALGSWSHQKAVTLHPVGGDECMWTTTVTVPKGVVTQYRYFKGFFLESKQHTRILMMDSLDFTVSWN